VPPFATPALCHASTCLGSLIEKPIVPPLAWVAGLPIDGFGHHKTPAIVRVNQPPFGGFSPWFTVHRDKQGIVEVLRPSDVVTPDHNMVETFRSLLISMRPPPPPPNRRGLRAGISMTGNDQQKRIISGLPSPRRRGSGTWSGLQHFWPNRDAPARAAISESGDLTAACTPAGFAPMPPLAETAQAILLRSPSGNCDDRALAYEISYQSDGSLGLGGFAAIFRNRPELARPNGDRGR
jgi:hypothetical protein